MMRSMVVAIGMLFGMIVFFHDLTMVLDPHGEASASHDAEHAEQTECGPTQGARLPSDDGPDAGAQEIVILTIGIWLVDSADALPDWEVPVVTGSDLRAMLQVYLN